jgi:DNA polymerase III delta prime subunit
MMSICFREGFKIAAPAVQEIIRSCNQDIRQTIHTLSMMAANTGGNFVKIEILTRVLR